MYIRELQLTGFKSFQDKSTLRFSPAMNAVIGPNGCGKTNILDALRWVLGEQSFNLLRCSRTEDLIFGGTARVPALNFAEVRLVLAQNPGQPAVEGVPSEIEIRRRYFRTGESEYFLNREPCRQKDIQEAFLATGMGTKAYSIFDLRQIRDIIAGNIRRMFEEAATLAKYQDAKADCERKLALTEADLTRLADIIAERERIVRSLRYQAGKQRSWEKLKEEERGYRLVELKAEHDATGAELEVLDRTAQDMELADAERAQTIGRLEEELARQRARLREGQSLKDELVEQARVLRERLAGLETEVASGAQRARFLVESARRSEQEVEELRGSSAESEQALNRVLAAIAAENARMEKLEQELEKAREQTRAAEDDLFKLRQAEQSRREHLRQLESSRSELEQRLAHARAVRENVAASVARAREERAGLDGRLGQCRASVEETAALARTQSGRLDDARAAVADRQEQLARADRERAALHAELARTRDRRHELEKELAVLAAALPDRAGAYAEVLKDELLGEIAACLKVEPGWERACEAVLQPVAEFLITRGSPAPETLAALVRTDTDIWVGLLPTASESEERRTPNPDSSPRLSDHVEVLPGAPELLRTIVNSAVVFDSAISTPHPPTPIPHSPVVCRDGWARFADGRVVVASRGQGRLRAALLKAEKEAALARFVALASELETKEREMELARTELDRRLEEARETAEAAVQQKLLLDARLDALVAKQAELERDLARLDRETAQYAATDADTGSSLDAAAAEAALVTEEAGRVAAALAEHETLVSERDREVRALLEQSSERLAAVTEQRQKLARLEAEAEYTRQQMEERTRRAAQLARTAQAAEADAETSRHQADALAPELDRVRAELGAVETRIADLRLSDTAAAEEELEGNLTELRHAREQNQSILMEHRMRRHELAQRRSGIEKEAREEHHCDIAAFRPESVEDIVSRLEQVRRRLSALGAVNPLARDEYEREREDLERLITRRDDVEGARRNLHETLAEIDRHARERFLETYREVRTHFREIFRQMFLEGEADLCLADETRPQESEVVIIARPRGKNPKRLEQLSDGEKALLAVSLLFAFYRVKPAPFCFLDEIDAPLDDANTGRFADYLKALSSTTQVIIITHNRLTVERADSLFGVTAQEPGISTLVSVNLSDYRSSPAAADIS